MGSESLLGRLARGWEANFALTIAGNERRTEVLRGGVQKCGKGKRDL